MECCHDLTSLALPTTTGRGGKRMDAGVTSCSPSGTEAHGRRGGSRRRCRPKRESTRARTPCGRRPGELRRPCRAPGRMRSRCRSREPADHQEVPVRAFDPSGQLVRLPGDRGHEWDARLDEGLSLGQVVQLGDVGDESALGGVRSIERPVPGALVVVVVDEPGGVVDPLDRWADSPTRSPLESVRRPMPQYLTTIAVEVGLHHASPPLSNSG